MSNESFLLLGTGGYVTNGIEESGWDAKFGVKPTNEKHDE
jgi:hypothetical protein